MAQDITVKMTQLPRGVAQQLKKEARQMDLTKGAFKTALDEVSSIHAYTQEKTRASLLAAQELRRAAEKKGAVPEEIEGQLMMMASQYTGVMSRILAQSSERMLQLADQIANQEVVPPGFFE